MKRILSLLLGLSMFVSSPTSVYAIDTPSITDDFTVTCILYDNEGNTYSIEGELIEPLLMDNARSNSTNYNEQSVSYSALIPASIMRGSGTNVSDPEWDDTGAVLMTITIYFLTGTEGNTPTIKLTSVKNDYVIYDPSVTVSSISTFCECSDSVSQTVTRTVSSPPSSSTVYTNFNRYVANIPGFSWVRARSTYTFNMGSQRTWTSEIDITHV